MTNTVVTGQNVLVVDDEHSIVDAGLSAASLFVPGVASAERLALAWGG